jgi:hypothetical protein
MQEMDAASRRERERFEKERDRNDRADLERLRAAARRPVGENLEEGIRLIAFAQQFQDGFRHGATGGH